jgi:signal transduction histidine kinase
VLSANNVAKNLLNDQDIINKFWFDAVKGTSKDKISSLAGSSKIIHDEIEINNKNILFSYRYLKQSNKIYIYGSDLTEVKKSENDLFLKAKEFAEEISLVKNKLLSNISNEVQTSLKSIANLSERLLKTELNHKQKEYSETINSSATLLLNLINEVIDLSKIESSQFKLNEEQLEIIINKWLTKEELKEQEEEQGQEEEQVEKNPGN